MKTPVLVELFYNNAWNDITEDVLVRDGIRITRGRPDQSSRVPPSTLDLSIKNTDGKYSPRNPESPLYGLIGRNQPIRVSLAGVPVSGYGGRFWGEVESWPQRWNVKGSDVWAPITANGIMRRLNAPGTAAPSWAPLRRSILAGEPDAYWPLEDGTDASQAGSGLSRLDPMMPSGTVTFEAPDRFYAHGSSGAANLAAGGTLKGYTLIPSSPAVSAITDGFEVEFVVGWDQAIPADDTNLVLQVTDSRNQTFGVAVHLDSQRYFAVVDPAGVLDYQGVTPVEAGVLYHLRMVVAINPAGALEQTLYLNDGGLEAQKNGGATTSIGSPRWVLINGTNTALDYQPANPDTFGHVAVWATTRANWDTVNGETGYAVSETFGFNPETAVERITRLCDEEGVTVTFIGDTDEAEQMGPQRTDTFLNLVNDAADVDGGILYESRNSFGFVYRIGYSLYNQDPALTLDYAAGNQVAPPLEPVEDTDAVVNDMVVNRVDGSSARFTETDGPLGTDTIGRYTEDVTLNLYRDSQCVQHASWRVHLGTVDEPRYPVVNVDFTALSGAAVTGLVADAAGLDIGDRLSITSPPSWLPPDSIEQLAQGFTEVLDSHHWTMAVNAEPALPYEVFVVETGDDNRSRIPAGATVTNEALDTTETGVDIVSTLVRWIDSATYGSMFPISIVIGGELMTCTAITGTGLTQVMTVTRSANGVVKSHAAGTAVQIFRPAVIAL